MLVLPEKSLTQPRSALPRLGQINFVNCLPVVVPMLQSSWQHNAEVFYATPTELNRSFEAKELDIGAMSSFYYLKNGTLRLIDGLSISSDGAVASVMCYSKKPLKDLDGATVAVPLCSATSINLMLALLQETFAVVPTLNYCDSPDINDPKVDAALVIGDQALRAEKAWSRKLVKADLGEWWRIVTGLPMVFGVWAAQSQWVNANQRSFDDISQALRQACTTGLGPQFDAVVEEGCARTGMSEIRIQQYFMRDLNYKMTSRHLQGLELYGDLCQKHGLFSQ